LGVNAAGGGTDAEGLLHDSATSARAITEHSFLITGSTPHVHDLGHRGGVQGGVQRHHWRAARTGRTFPCVDVTMTARLP
jgi:hypothetical protein